MASEIREYLAAAQQAELSGDKPRAIELLMKCATLYRNAGNMTRALQMLRQARRLDGTRDDIADEVKRLEWLPDTSLAKAVDEGEAASDAEKALAPLEQLEPEAPKRLIERGPAKADPTLQAWCSFCCRPKNEIGELVAGPAGAFICAACLKESSALLGISAPSPEPATPKPAPAPQPSATAPVDGFVGQPEAAAQLDSALRSRASLVLLVGPRGCGKTSLLRDLERRGLGVHAATAEALRSVPPEQRLLWDGELGREVMELLSRGSPDRQVVVTARSHVLDSAFTLLGDSGPLPMFSSHAIVEGTQGAVPLALAERAQAVVVMRHLKADELREVARVHAQARAHELEVGDEVLAAIADEALRSERGGHEVEALVRRIPPGTWTVAAQEPTPGDTPAGKAGNANAASASAPAAGSTPAAGSRRRGKRRGEG